MVEPSDKTARPPGEPRAEDDAAKGFAEKRRFERFKTELQITFSLAAPGETEAFPREGFIAPDAFKPGSVEMSDFKRLLTEEVVVGENISLQGLKISVPQPVSEGARVWLRIRLPGLALPLNAIGEVRWCHSTGSSWNAGLKFVALGKKELAQMDEFLLAQGPAGDGAKPLTAAEEKRAFERRRTALRIGYRVVSPEEEAVMRREGYDESEAHRGEPASALHFNDLSDAELVVSEDISLGGLKINVSNPVSEGMLLKLKVAIPGVPIPVNAIGEVRWCRAVGTQWNAGLQFVGLNKADLDKVERFLALQKRGEMAKRK